MLFLDDRTKRIEAAREQYRDQYDLTIVTNVPECLRYLSREDWELVSLDFDLGGCDFVDPNSPTCGMEVIRYLEKTRWPDRKIPPRFIIHSSNVFAAGLMKDHLRKMGFVADDNLFEYEPSKKKQYEVGLVAGAFDILHPGYIALFQDAKTICNFLIVALHANNGKYTPVFNTRERTEILLATKYVDRVITYCSENDLIQILREEKPDVRILGNDYATKSITGGDLGIPIYFHQRNTDWSETAVRNSLKEGKE